MTQSFDSIVAHIIAAERVTPEDTMALRQIVYAAPSIDHMQAESIFAINNSAHKTCPQWVDFFVEAITAHLVEQVAPRGFVDDENARWLIAQMDKDGRIETRAELLLLIAILEKAQNVADRLKEYAVAQVEHTVMTGEGPTRLGGAIRPGVIDEAEVALLRRILYASGSDGANVISEAEARMLFRLKDATLGGANAQGWPTLFVQLVGNHMMAHPMSHQMTRERAAEVDAFMNDTAPAIGSFLTRLEESFLHPSKAFGVSHVDAVDRSDAAIAEDLRITVDEANWLKDQILADGQIDALEKALLAFIIDESGPLPVAIEAPQALRA